MKLGIIASHRTIVSTNLQKDILSTYSNIVCLDSLDDIASTDIDFLIALGGDGFTLRILHKIINHSKNIRVYGINCGNVGFLLNNFDISKDNLIDKINNAIILTLEPLQIELEDRDEKIQKVYAINEISLIRQTYQAVNVRITIDNEVRIANLIGDGVLLATTAGSAAYNASAGGVILPLNSGLLTVTAINPFRPRRWKSAIVDRDCLVEFEIFNDSTRHVLACADFNQFYFIRKVKAKLDQTIKYNLLFDKESHLEDKIMDEQFIF